MLHHVGEEVFLAPPGEHPTSDYDVVQFMRSADHSRLVSRGGQSPHLLHRQGVAESGFPHRQLHRDLHAVGYDHLGVGEFALRPHVLDVLAIRDGANPLPPERFKKNGGGALAVEDQHKAM